MRLSFVVLILCCLLNSSVLAAGGRQQLDDFLTGLISLQANFEQSIVGNNNDVYRSSGVFYLERPGLMRWNYLSPDAQTIVADGRRVWLFDEELEQVSHKSQKSALEGTPAQLLSDSSTSIDEQFKVKDLGETNGLTWVELLPQIKDAEFTRILLAFSDNSLLKMEMVDSFGQLTQFEFSDIQRNIELDRKLFKFTPPPGFDVLGEN